MTDKKAKIRKIFLGIGVLIFVITTAVAIAWYTDRHAVTEPLPVREQRIVVGCTDNFPPFDLRDKDGDHIGYARDISTEVARELGYNIEYKTSPRWVEVVEWLKNGDVDLIHLIAYSPERDEYFDFTIPHTLVPEVIFVRSERLDIRGLDDLEGKQIGAVRQHITHEKLLKHEGLDIIVFETPDEGVEALLDGKVDAFAYPQFVFEYLVQQLGREDEIKIVGEPIGTLRYCMAVREGDHVLLSHLDSAIQQIEASGKRDEIAQRWFGRKVFLGLTREEVLSLIGWAVFGLLVISISGSAYISIRYRLRKAEAVLRHNLIFQHMDDSVILTSLDGKITDWNPGAERMFGHSREEILGRRLDFLLAPEGSTELFETIIREVQGAGIWSGEIRAIRKDGSQGTCSVKMTALRDEKGDSTAYVSILRDISERKRAEEQVLRQSAVLDAINKVFRETLRCETDEEVARISLAVAEELTGSKFGFIGEVNESGRFDTLALSDPGWGACRMPKSDAVRMVKDMEICGIWGGVLKDGRSLIANDPASHPDRVGVPEGHPPLTSFLGVPLKREGKAISMIALANKERGYNLADQEDIEALSVAFLEALIRKRAEEALRKAHDELEIKVAERTKELTQANIQLKELDQLKSMFIASMSHELRTPLNSIIGFTGIILQGMTGEITEEQRKQLTMVKNSANHLLDLINDIIDLSKIEADKVELIIEEFDLSGLVQDVRDSFMVAAEEKDLKMSLKMPKRLVINSDERRTKQVLVNLVSNAVKFTDRGEIEIKVAKKDGKAEISVADTGSGIKKEDMDRLFRAFSQVPLEGRVEEGTGLGLYLSKKITDLLGGEIRAESEFGKGSVFTFTLPLKHKEAKT